MAAKFAVRTATDADRHDARPAPTLSEAADRAERGKQGNPRIVPDSAQRTRSKGETDSDDEPEWPRTESDTVRMSAVERQLADAVRDAELSPKKAAIIPDNLKLPKRRQSPYGGKVATAHPPAKPRKRKGDGDGDKATTARKPVLMLGR